MEKYDFYSALDSIVRGEPAKKVLKITNEQAIEEITSYAKLVETSKGICTAMYYAEKAWNAYLLAHSEETQRLADSLHSNPLDLEHTPFAEGM